MGMRVTVAFRRVAAFTIAGVLALVPATSHGLGEEAAPVPYTNCALGYETFEYDGLAGVWNASATTQCTKTYPQLSLSVSVVLVQATGNSLTIAPSMTFCLSCPGLQHHATRPSPFLTPGLYQVRSAVRVMLESQVPIDGKHASCFLVKDAEAKPLMAGCPEIR